MMKKALTLLLICLTSLANAQSSLNMNLLGTYDYPTTEGNDIWGWVDSIGNEFALVGLRSGFSVVNVTNPSSPVEEFFISDINSIWRDVKTWGNYAYVTTEANAGLLIVDLYSGAYIHVTQFTNNNGGSVSFTSAHDIYIDENGIAYIFGAGGPGPQSNGAIFLDVDANPMNPVYLGEWSDEYIHDGMVRGDTMWAGCVYAGKLFCVDVSDKTNPQTLGSATTPDAFTHNVWISDNGKYAFTTDEQSDAYLTAFDVSDLSNIFEVDRIQSNPGSNSIPHNTFVDGNFLITSYYRDGTTVHDITYPNNMIQVAYYDSYSGSGSGFDGCWGTYPYLPSGNIISSDINSGPGGAGQLLIYGRDFQQASFLSGTVTNANTGSLITNATIEIVGTPYTTTTNLLGEYTLGSINSGVFQVLFSASGYIPITLNVTLSSGNITILDAALFTIGSVPGCTDSTALNYNPLATIDDGSCLYCNLSATINTLQHVTCFGDSTGVAEAIVIGGQFPYTYAWDNGETNNIATGLWADWQGITFTDANGCTLIDSIEIIQLYPEIQAYNTLDGTNTAQIVQDASCFGVCDGIATLSTIGGVLPHTYYWDVGQTSLNMPDTAFNLCAGGHDVIVEDANGCRQTILFTITEPALLSSMISFTDISCYNACDGSVSVSVSGGGIPPYNYFWSNGQTTSSITNLCADTYTCTVTDANGCSVNSFVTITEPDSLQVEIIDSLTVFPYCAGTNSGQLCAIASGGALPYNYLWSDILGQATPCASNLIADQYTVTVQDNNNCIASVSFNLDSIINIMTSDSVDMTIVDASCFGGHNGSVTINVVGGGAPPFNYNWIGPNSFNSTTNPITSLYAGSYAVVIEDNNGCAVTVNAQVGQPDELTYTTYNVIGETCFGDCDGQIWVDVQGGTVPYFYDESQSNTAPPFANQVQLVNDSIISNLCADNSPYSNPYAIYITDANDCEAALIFGGTYVELVDSGIVVNTSLAVTSNYTGQDISCYGSCDGSASVNVSGGGAPPYNYSWSNGQTTPSITNLCAGTYTCTVTEANGCSVNSSITINEPIILSSMISFTDISCYGSCDGSASVSVSGGTPPYNYAWSNGQTTSSITNLCAGTYLVDVTDVNGCVITQAIMIGEPSTILTSIAVTPVSCFGVNDGEIIITATGGVFPYQYSLGTGLSQSNGTFIGLTAGTYSVDVTDSNGCMVFQTVVITEPPTLNITASTVTHVSCYGDCDGSASVGVAGGTPTYIYSWSNGQTTPSITNLCAGTYTCTVYDANNCSAQSSTIIVTEPDPLSISVDSTDETFVLNDGSATAFVNGGTVPYTYLWSNGGTTNPLNNLPPGLYTIDVTDANGCIISGSTFVNAYNFTGIVNIQNTSKMLIKVTDILGQETPYRRNTPLFYIYNDGTVEKRIVIE